MANVFDAAAPPVPSDERRGVYTMGAPPVPEDAKSHELLATRRQGLAQSFAKWGLGLPAAWGGIAYGAGSDLGRLAIAASSGVSYGVLKAFDGSPMEVGRDVLSAFQRTSRNYGATPSVRLLRDREEHLKKAVEGGAWNAFTQSAENMSKGVVGMLSEFGNITPTGKERSDILESVSADFRRGNRFGGEFAAGAVINPAMQIGNIASVVNAKNEIVGDPMGVLFGAVPIAKAAWAGAGGRAAAVRAMPAAWRDRAEAGFRAMDDLAVKTGLAEGGPVYDKPSGYYQGKRQKALNAEAEAKAVAEGSPIAGMLDEKGVWTGDPAAQPPAIAKAGWPAVKRFAGDPLPRTAGAAARAVGRVGWGALKGMGYGSDLIGLVPAGLAGAALELAPTMMALLLKAGRTQKVVAQVLESEAFKVDPEGAIEHAEAIINEKLAASKRYFADRAAQADPGAQQMARSQLDEPHRTAAAIQNLGDENSFRVADDPDVAFDPAGPQLPDVRQVDRTSTLTPEGLVVDGADVIRERGRLSAERAQTMTDIVATKDRIEALKAERAKIRPTVDPATGEPVLTTIEKLQIKRLTAAIKHTETQLGNMVNDLPESHQRQQQIYRQRHFDEANRDRAPLTPPELVDEPNVVTPDESLEMSMESEAREPAAGRIYGEHSERRGLGPAPVEIPFDRPPKLYPEQGPGRVLEGEHVQRRPVDPFDLEPFGMRPEPASEAPAPKPAPAQSNPFALPQRFYTEANERAAALQAAHQAAQAPAPKPAPSPKKARHTDTEHEGKAPITPAKMRDDADGAALSVRQATAEAGRAHLAALEAENAAELAIDDNGNALPLQKQLNERAAAKREVADLAETYANALKRVKDEVAAYEEALDEHAGAAKKAIEAAVARKANQTPSLFGPDRVDIDAALTRAAKIRVQLEAAIAKADAPGPRFPVWTDMVGEEFADVRRRLRRLDPEGFNDLEQTPDYEAAADAYNRTEVAGIEGEVQARRPEAEVYAEADKVPPVAPKKPAVPWDEDGPPIDDIEAPPEGGYDALDAFDLEPKPDPTEPPAQPRTKPRNGSAFDRFADEHGEDITWLNDTGKGISEVAWDANLPKSLVKRYFELKGLKDHQSERTAQFVRLKGRGLDRIKKIADENEAKDFGPVLEAVAKEDAAAAETAKKAKLTAVFENKIAVAEATGWDPAASKARTSLDVDDGGAVSTRILKGHDVEAALGREAGQWSETPSDSRSWKTNNPDVNDLVERIADNAEGLVRTLGPVKTKISREAILRELTEPLVENSLLLARDRAFRGSLVGRLAKALGLNDKQRAALDGVLEAEANKRFDARANNLTVDVQKVTVNFDDTLKWLNEKQGEGKAPLVKSSPATVNRVVGAIARAMGYSLGDNSAPLPAVVARVLLPAALKWSQGRTTAIEIPTVPINVRNAIANAVHNVKDPKMLAAARGEIMRSVAFQVADDAQSNAILASIDAERSRFVPSVTPGDVHLTAIEMAGRMLAGETPGQVWVGDQINPHGIGKALKSIASDLQNMAEGRAVGDLAKILAIAEREGLPSGMPVKVLRQKLIQMAQRIQTDVVKIKGGAVEHLVAHASGYKGGDLSGTIWATKGFGAVLARQIAALTYSRQLDSVARNLNRAALANATSRNPAGFVANFLGALVPMTQVMGVDPVTGMHRYVRSWQWLEDGRKGKLESFDKELHRAMVETGLLDTGSYFGEIATIAQVAEKFGLQKRSPARELLNKVKPVKMVEAMEAAYKKNDTAAKATLGRWTIDRVLKEIRALDERHTYTMGLTPETSWSIERLPDDQGYTVRSGRDRFTFQMPTKPGDWSSPEARKFLALVAKSSMRGPSEVLFNFVDVPGIIDDNRKMIGFGSPFFTFPYKAMSAPGKRGLVDTVLHYNNLYLGATQSPAVLALRSKSNLALALRRATLLGGMQNSLGDKTDNREDRTNIAGKQTPTMQSSRWTASEIPGISFINDYSGSNYMESTDRFMRVSSAILGLVMHPTDGVIIDKKTPEDKVAELRATNNALMRLATGKHAAVSDAFMLLGIGNTMIHRIYDLAEARTPQEKIAAETNLVQGAGKILMPAFMAAGLDIGLGIANPSSAYSTRQPKETWNLPPEDVARHIFAALLNIGAKRVSDKDSFDAFEKMIYAQGEVLTGADEVALNKYLVDLRATLRRANAFGPETEGNLQAMKAEALKGRKELNAADKLVAVMLKDFVANMKLRIKPKPHANYTPPEDVDDTTPPPDTANPETATPKAAE